MGDKAVGNIAHLWIICISMYCYLKFLGHVNWFFFNDFLLLADIVL
jgi:hypothetical protein